MYLKQLYQQSKFWFIVVCLFMMIQLTLDIRRDASISPFYHYGMYSQVIKPQKIYVVPQVTVNGKILQTKDFSPQEWDKIIQPVTMYNEQDKWNRQLFAQHIQPLLHTNEVEKYTNHFSDNDFHKWYKEYLQTIVKQPVISFSINYTITAYSNKKLSLKN